MTTSTHVDIDSQLDRIEDKLDQVLERLGVAHGGNGHEARHPSAVLDLRNWTIMLPTGHEGDPDNKYVIGETIPNTLFVAADGAVVFRTPADGFHSPHSKYARTEAREMVNAEWDESAWSSSAGTHSLECDLAIDTSGLVTRKRINGMQIHGGDDDVCQLMAREDGRLGLAHKDGKSFEVIDPDYRGERFTCKIVAGDGRLKVFYNGEQRIDIAKSGSGWYWKFGCYLQSGGASDNKEPAGAFGQVKVWSYTKETD